MKRRFDNWKAPEILHGVPTIYNWVVQNPQGLSLGRGSDLGAFTYINALHGVEIGEEAQLGSHCSVYSVSTIDDKTGPVVIGKNARIGSHSTIMPGVTIGDDAVVGAHSFVNADVPAGALAYGVPARVVRMIEQGKS